MTAAWSEQLPDRSREDLKRHAQFLLASLGAVSLLGTLFGACAAWMRSAACWCCNPEDEEPCQ